MNCDTNEGQCTRSGIDIDTMRDVALLGINPGMSTAFLDRGRGRLACAACLGNLSASALTIPGASTRKTTKNNAMHGPNGKASIIMTTRHP